MKKILLTNLRMAFRNLSKNKILNGINILGLSIGIMASLLIFQHIRFENSYDTYPDKADQIYRLAFFRHYTTGLDKSVGNNYMIGQMAAENIPEIENFLRCKKSTQYMQVDNEIYKEERAFFADSSFFDLFTRPVIAGNKSDFLNAPNVVVITESTARKYFGNENPIGKTIYRVNPGKTPLLVQGVVKDVPLNTHLKFDMVISLSSLIDSSYCYTCNNTNTYFVLRKESNLKDVTAKIKHLSLKFFKSKGLKIDFPVEYRLQKLKDIHLHSHYRYEHEANGNYTYQLALIIVALFVLLSAWLNYSNIYRALIKKRIKNIGIRKINGASWSSFAGDFITEALITGFISLIFAYAMLSVMFSNLKDYLQLDYSFGWIMNFETLLFSILLIALLSAVVGILISLRFLKTKPLHLIHNKVWQIAYKKPGNAVLIIQFSIAIFLIASTFIAIKQINYMQTSALSMNMDQVLTVKRPAGKNYNALQKIFEENLKQIPGITEISYSTITPGQKNTWVKGGITIKGSSQESDQLYQANVAPGFFDFFNVKLIAGRSFYPDETNWQEGARHVILNKQAAMALGSTNYTDLLGRILFDSDNQTEIGKIVGIVDGYFQNSLEQEVAPTVFNPDQFGSYLFIKIHNLNPVEAIAKIKAEYHEYFRDSYFEYFFLDDFFNTQYQAHIQFNRCFILFSLIAIIISVLSLLGVVITKSASRIKEIGIRKVNGARTLEILALLNKDFMRGVAIAIVIAIPFAWYVMDRWLENFAYKTELSWWVFALAGALALGIALLTVSWQSWRAATRNPVDALRYE